MDGDKEQIKHFFRVFNTDLDGKKPIGIALLKVRGFGFGMANAICNSLSIPKNKKAGLFTESDAKRMESLFKEGKLPIWIFNRRADETSGETKHIIGGDLKFAVDFDVKRMMRLKSYRGLRHSSGQPVRGQRTRSHFRKSGKAIGVQKSKASKKG